MAYYGTDADETITVTSNGGDSADGGGGNDVITGAAGNDYLVGGLGADTINGGAGDDVLAGAGGDDRLTGGAGVDVFQFSGAWGMDTITDFEKGLDHLDLRATGLGYGDLQFATSGTSTIVHVAGFGDVTILNTVSTGLAASDFWFT